MVFLTIGLITLIVNFLRSAEFRRDIVKVRGAGIWETVLAGLMLAIGGIMTHTALNYALVAYASAFKRLEVVWVMVFAGVFLREKKLGIKTLSALIMILGIVILVIANA